MFFFLGNCGWSGLKTLSKNVIEFGEARIIGGDKGARVGALPVELLRQTPVPS